MANMLPIPANTPQAQATSLINNNFRALNNEQVTKVYKDQNGIPNIIMGILPDGTTGIVIAEQGQNVLNAF